MATHQRKGIVMTEAEVERFVQDRRTAILATLGKDGWPHLSAMWFGLVDGRIALETKAKSQKVLNIRRDPRITVLFEWGATYPELRGVAFEGHAEIVENDAANRDVIHAIGRSVMGRYSGSEAVPPDDAVDTMMNKRVGIFLNVKRVRSWDHRKLGMDLTAPPQGSSAVDIRGWTPSAAVDAV